MSNLIKLNKIAVAAQKNDQQLYKYIQNSGSSNVLFCSLNKSKLLGGGSV